MELDTIIQTDNKESLIALLKKIGKEDATIFFNYAFKLLKQLNITEEDKRLTYGTRENNRLTITIGQRYCFSFIPDRTLSWGFIQDVSMPSSNNIETSKFDGNPEAYYYECNSSEMINHFSVIVQASKKELDRTEVSGYRKYNNPLFEKAIFDSNFRNELFEAAFGTVINLTGHIWKLGCNWGKGNPPSFYEMIKARSIVIGLNDRLYSIGDLIVITKGYTVYALGKILDTPIPVTDVPELEDEFNKYQIEYDDYINIANVEWYELEEDERFVYQLQSGIRRVNASYIRDRAITIWNDRFIDYWVFQCNPMDFDFESAVRNNLLHDWTIAAHKDKIKKGDKAIIWLTGKKAGCYALAQITSDPSETNVPSSDSHLWKTERKNSLKVGIKVTNNLLDRPVLWHTIKETEGLTDLKVGIQGTNFSATRKQYNILLKLIDNNISMDDKIDLSLNTILYGPPGTGKTFKLNEYKDLYFIDKGIIKSSEELLKEKVGIYPLWKLVGAILGVASKPLTVGEIVSHPIIKVTVNPNRKTKPNTSVWGSLQFYADDKSTQLDDKYRRSIQVFQKNSESKWSISDDKKAEIHDIIGQELLDIAKNPSLQPIQSTTSRFNFITFHQKYSYEDFIEGIKPLLNKDDEEEQNNLQFELKTGIFYESCLEALKLVGYESFIDCYNDSIEGRIAKFANARNNTKQQFALFIDEINRANISAVFGELITLLEEDKRIGADNETWVELPYSNEKFCVPANLYVIGTMNTADRSIALLDIALRRRFEFKGLYPLYTETEWWASLLENINQAIYNWKKNPDFFIGHAFFINKSESDRIKILNTKIIPLLYEYCQNNTDTVKRILSDAGIQIRSTSIKDNFQIIAE